jgi:hypothetical protein
MSEKQESSQNKTIDLREIIYLIESPSALDLLEDRNEGDALAHILGLAEIEVVYFLAVNDETFEAAICKIKEDIVRRSNYQTAMPFIHISAHGSKEGLELTDGDVILWEKLNQLLVQLHAYVGPALLPPEFPQGLPKTTICLSSCSAFDPYANASPKPAPYQALIGPNKDVGWCEALIAFSTFYYQACILEKSFDVALVAMNFASGAAYGGRATYELKMPHR